MSRKRRRIPLNRHHILPRSRFPPTASKEVMDWDNVVEIDVDLHRAWHFLFSTLDPDEAIKLIRYAMQPNLRWTYREWQRLIEHIKEKS